MIKAIETEWKGYRFRSRLEARWAVFFEHMGWDWVYEPQGFETSHGRYLPDFYVSDIDTWFEIKPDRGGNFRPPKVYLAGKVGHNCWRRDIAPAIRDCLDYDDPYGWAEALCRIGGRMMNTNGPFFRSCDHGCGHGPATHGQGEAPCFEGLPAGSSDTYRECMTAITNCNIFFAWIDSHDCYGTLIEAGYARALGKPVLVGFSRDAFNSSLVNIRSDISGGHGAWGENTKSEFWFLIQTADRHGVFQNAKGAFSTLVPPCPREKEILKLEEVSRGSNAKWSFCTGDPLEGDVFGTFCDFPKGWERSAQIARSARFEHGEKPKVRMP